MHFFKYIYLLILAFTTTSTAARKSSESVLLSHVKSLTLRKDLKTSHNRVSAVPQLNCIGGTAKGFYDIDVLRCKNAGSSYGDEDVQWTCTASLPSEFKLGSTDVICEGFSSSEDPYVLKGSCGVEYRLMLTKLGEEKYGGKGKDMWGAYDGRSKGGDWAAVIFWFIFIAVVGWMVYAALIRDSLGRRPPGAAPNPWFGGGGGGNNDDPPPPYEYRPSPKAKATSSRAPRAAPAQTQGGWRPGFWSGALGGAAAGYMAGNRGQSQQPRNQSTRNFSGVNGRGNGEGSSNLAGVGGGRTRSSESSSSNSGYGSSRHESSGFGGTSRR
ncbi:hypothetical protein HO173_000337 [Letharia columbiana]|uniref:Store-operated calcium entry-associated regulatory factor n=1 Tax=Letharia columbiana TaxID=112416 RepID=A0A8H6G6X2_9LECA|nr:uncharacterized protein HO173_000337 [Letharia columbiana]KAF6241626.1 hypothetical protein HO173_000337 [Letharia columbiana]